MVVLVVMVVMVMTLMVADMVAEEMKKNNRHVEVEEAEVEEVEENKNVNYRALEANARNTANLWYHKLLKVYEEIIDFNCEIAGTPLRVLTGEYTEENATEIASLWEAKREELQKKSDKCHENFKKYWAMANTFKEKGRKIA